MLKLLFCGAHFRAMDGSRPAHLNSRMLSPGISGEFAPVNCREDHRDCPANALRVSAIVSGRCATSQRHCTRKTTRSAAAIFCALWTSNRGLRVVIEFFNLSRDVAGTVVPGIGVILAPARLQQRGFRRQSRGPEASGKRRLQSLPHCPSRVRERERRL